MSTTQTTTPRGLGRRFAHDIRDANYPMRLAVPLTGRLPKRTFWSVRGSIHATPLDQGSTGTCVGQAWWNALRYGPVERTPAYTPYALYREIVKVDEWTENDTEAEGPDSDLQFGSSVRAGAKVLRSQGLLQSYVWGHDLDSTLRYLMLRGPVVLGVNWYSGMMRTDANLFIRRTGTRVGGHAVCLIGANRVAGFVVLANSWGADWGELGLARLSFRDLDRLIREEGEACAPLETPISALGLVS